MTFIPALHGIVSTTNSSSSTLGAAGEFLGTAEDVSKYETIHVFVKANQNSAAAGVKFEFSSDGTNWDIIKGFSYFSSDVFEREIKVSSQFFRVRYTTVLSQSTFRLQTTFKLAAKEKREEKFEFPQDFSTAPSFRTESEKHILFSCDNTSGRNLRIKYEETTGSANIDTFGFSPFIRLNVTGVGVAMRRSRSRISYVTGSKLFIQMTGTLDHSVANGADVTSQIGYMDDTEGYFFQYLNNTLSINRKSSQGGNLSIDRSDWNVNPLGGVNGIPTFTPSLMQTFWIEFGWADMGIVKCGIVYKGQYITLHVFNELNLSSTPAITTGTLYITYRIESLGNTGRMIDLAQSAYIYSSMPVGKPFSINRGTASIPITSTRYPILTLRMKAGSSAVARLQDISVISTSNGNILMELYRFTDTAVASVLDNTAFVSADSDSDVEYNTAATSLLSLVGGTLITSKYFANNIDTGSLEKYFNSAEFSVTNGEPDLMVICTSSVGGAENVTAGANWVEFT